MKRNVYRGFDKTGKTVEQVLIEGLGLYVPFESYKKSKERISELEQAIMSNCYDDPSASGKRLMALVTKGCDV